MGFMYTKSLPAGQKPSTGTTRTTTSSVITGTGCVTAVGFPFTALAADPANPADVVIYPDFVAAPTNPVGVSTTSLAPEMAWTAGVSASFAPSQPGVYQISYGFNGTLTDSANAITAHAIFVGLLYDLRTTAAMPALNLTAANDVFLQNMVSWSRSTVGAGGALLVLPVRGEGTVLLKLDMYHRVTPVVRMACTVTNLDTLTLTSGTAAASNCTGTYFNYVQVG